MTKAEKVKYALKLLDKLYCFSGEEISDFKNKIPLMKEEGLEKLIQVFIDGKKQQDAVFSHFIEKNADFSNHFLSFIKQSSKQLKNEYEKQEKNEADLILKELE